MIQPIKENEEQGLILGLDFRKEVRSYCTDTMCKSNNNSAHLPKKNAMANTATHCYINGQVGSMKLNEPPSPVITVIEDYEWIKYAYPKWRHTNHNVRSSYIQKALSKRSVEHGHNQYAISMRFSPDFAKKVINEGGATYLHERLTEQLKRALGFSPDLWLKIEATCVEKNGTAKSYNIAERKGSVSRSEGVLHMHGAIALSERYLATVKLVVRKLNRSMNSIFKNHELNLKLIHNEQGWVNYCNKHPLLNQMFLGELNTYSRTKNLSSLAKRLYEEDRLKFKQVRICLS